METSTRRSSSRIRKPTLKLIELGSGSVPRSQHENEEKCTTDSSILKEPIKKIRVNHENNHTQQEVTNVNFCYTKNMGAVLKTTSQSQAVKKFKSEVQSEQTPFELCQKSVDRDVGMHEHSPEIKKITKLEKDVEVETGKEVGASLSKNAAHDLKAVRKCTVRVLLNGDIQNKKKADIVDCISVGKDKLLAKCYKKESENDKRRVDALENIKQKGPVYKEDGSLVEDCVSDGFYKQPRSLSKTCIDSEKSINNKEASDKNESIEEHFWNEEDEYMSSDVEAQIKIEFDEFAETAEMKEVDFDFDEQKMEKSLECPKCFKVLSNRCNLTKHMALHRADKPFQCEICGMSFAVQAYLRIHSVVHSGKRKHKCDTCGKSFLRRSNLNTHRRTHTDVKAFSCDSCDKKFKTKLGRDLHMKEHVKGLGFKCDHCGKFFNQQSYLQRHISVHKGEKPFECKVCGKSFSYNQSLQEHMRTHTGEKPEVCGRCGKCFNNKRQLKAHMKYHNTVSDFACEECHMFYDSKQSLNKHITKTHHRKHECDYCKQSFVNKKHLRTHQAVEHKDLLASSRRIPPMNLAKAKKAECSLCKRVFFNRYVLSKHLMSKHQLQEKDMKALLQIRKKAVNKKQIKKIKISDVKDFSKLLENDKSFRVYYKDDEMAVYVKGTDDLDSRLKGMNEGHIVSEIANVPNEDVRYVVYEDNNDVANGFTECTEISRSSDLSEVVNLTDSVIQSIRAVSEEEKVSTSSVVSNVIKTDVENVGAEDQNYYVVYTDANENSEGTAKILDNKFVSQTEIHDINDDETERIVLILNEGEGGKNIMLENGEQYEIVTDNTDILSEGIIKQGDEYEVVSTGPVMVPVEMSYEESFESKSGNIVEANNDNDAFVSEIQQDSGRNLPLLEQLQTQGSLHNIQAQHDKNERTDKNNIIKEIDKGSQTVKHFTDENGITGESVEIQYPIMHPSENLTSTEENVIVIPAMDGTASVCSMPATSIEAISYAEVVNTDSQAPGSSLGELLPKSNTALEFTNFENAVKLKLGDFRNQEDYNDFLEKMIQTLQKAKQRDPE